MIEMCKVFFEFSQSWYISYGWQLFLQNEINILFNRSLIVEFDDYFYTFVKFIKLQAVILAKIIQQVKLGILVEVEALQV